MHEFDTGGELDVRVAFVAAHGGRSQRQHRPQPLAAGGDQVVGHLRDHLDIRTCLGQDQLVHPLHVRLRQIDEWLDGSRLLLAFFKRYDEAQGSALLFKCRDGL